MEYSFDFIDLPGTFFRAQKKEETVADLTGRVAVKAKEGWKLHSLTRVSASSASGGTFLFVFERSAKA